MTNSLKLRKRIRKNERFTEDKVMKTMIIEEDELYTKNMLGTKQEVLNEEQKILGVHWNFMEDRLIFDIHHIADLAAELKPTKRNVVGM